MKGFLFALIFVLLHHFPAFAATEVLVRSETATLYDSPEGRAVGSVQKGKKLKAEEVQKDGFRKLRTKSGRALWVHEDDVEVLKTGAEEDLVAEDVETPAEPEYDKFTWDLGFSTGASGGRTYSEANVGFNYFIQHWLAWRNAVFGRFTQPENFYGLDSSLRAFLNVGSNTAGFTVFGGPGYRFATKGDSVPFAEAGLITHLGSFTLGGGAKTFFTQAVRSGAEPDTQYFIILSGGGAF